jgi:hypothetical protein
VRVAILVLLAAIQGIAQTTTATNGSAKSSGECSVAHSGNYDTITIQNCGMGEEQGKKIEELLNKVLTNHDMADANAKLDQLLAIVSSLGPPKIVFDNPKDLPPSATGHPRQSVDFYTDRPDEDAQFGVVCDRACNPFDICTLQGANSGVLGHLLTNPEVAVFLFRRQVPALTTCTLSVESADDKPIKIIGMKHLLITDGRMFVPNATQPQHCVVAGGALMC